MIEPGHEFIFTSIVEGETPGSYQAIWVVPSGLRYFEGHFPENPVLPAIGIIDGTAEALGLILKKKLFPVGVQNAKFTGLVTPGTTICISLSKIAENEWNAEWKLIGLDAPPRSVAELRIQLGSEESFATIV